MSAINIKLKQDWVLNMKYYIIQVEISSQNIRKI